MNSSHFSFFSSLSVLFLGPLMNVLKQDPRAHLREAVEPFNAQGYQHDMQHGGCCSGPQEGFLSCIRIEATLLPRISPSRLSITADLT